MHRVLSYCVLMTLVLTLVLVGISCTKTVYVVAPTATAKPSSVGSSSATGGSAVNTKSAIIGKWRHGLPEECPANMDPKLYQQLKAMNLPENETYYLEFFKNGKILCESPDGHIMDGTYNFISDNYLEITWNYMAGTLAWELFGGHGVYEVHLAGSQMTLKGGQGLDTSYWRSD